MKVRLAMNKQVDEQTVKTLPVRVCMHIRGRSRNNIRLLRAAAALVHEGFVVSIVDIEDDTTRLLEEELDGIHLQHVFPARTLLRTRFKLRTFIKSLQRLLVARADVYYAYDTTTLPACYIAAWLHSKPLIFDSPELPFSNMPSHWKRFEKLFRNALARVLPRCAGVITVSAYIGRELQDCFHAPEVTLVRNLPEYKEVVRSDRLRQYLCLEGKTRIALYQGNIQPDRSLEMLVRTAPFLDPDIVIVMMGSGDEATLARLNELIAQVGVSEQVKILPAVPYEDLLNWTASADLGLVVLSPDYSLSIRWCLPNKLFEYLMAGLPVLATSLDAVQEIIERYDVGDVVPAYEPVAIAEAINTLLDNREELERMRRNALAAAQQELCWEKESRTLIHLCQEILA